MHVCKDSNNIMCYLRTSTTDSCGCTPQNTQPSKAIILVNKIKIQIQETTTFVPSLKPMHTAVPKLDSSKAKEMGEEEPANEAPSNPDCPVTLCMVLGSVGTAGPS